MGSSLIQTPERWLSTLLEGWPGESPGGRRGVVPQCLKAGRVRAPGEDEELFHSATAPSPDGALAFKFLTGSFTKAVIGMS
eukprot:gene16280-biopygen8854